MTSIKLMLNRQRANKDGTYSLIFQIIRNRKKKVIYTSIRLYEDEFDPESENIVMARKRKSRSGYLKSARSFLKSQKDALLRLRDYLDNHSPQYTVDDLIAIFRKRSDMQRPAVFVDSVIAGLREEGRNGTANNYKSLYNAVERFMDGRELLFNDIDSHWVRNFESYLRTRGLKRNTIAFYLRTAKTIYTRAKKEGVISDSTDPFQGINMKEEETLKRAIDKDMIKRIARADLSSESKLVQWARDFFMFSFYTRGMSFVDMAHLRKSDVSGDLLRYRRRKTGQLLQMKIESPLQELIDKYQNPSIYVLPLLIENDSYKYYRYIQRRMNKAIRSLGDILNFAFPLTFYIARHSWATLARKEGIPLAVISEGMGHTSEHTTRIYLAQLDPEDIDTANRKVISLD